MLLRRLLAPAVASAALVASVAAPASADPAQGTYVVTMTGATAGVFLNGLQISATCAIASTGPVAATVIDDCWLEGNSDASHNTIALSGNAAAISFVERVDTLDFQLCYRGHVVPITQPNTQYPVEGCAGDIGDLGLVTSGLSQQTY